MNPIFAADAAAIFEGPLSVAAIYTPATGSPFQIRVIPSVGDAMSSFGGSKYSRPAGVFFVLTTAVPSPAEGDRISIETLGEFCVQGAPVRDERRLRWRVEARPL